MTIDTTKLRELAQKATPGPWGYELDHGSFLRIYSDAGSGIVDGCGCCGSPNCDEVNATFIAAANPATVLTLLDERDELERMFHDACHNLAAINFLLMTHPEKIMEEISRLKNIEAAARNLAKVRGRHNSEIAMNQLLEVLK